MWFYDERGVELFDEITRLPEYYPTRARAVDPRRARRRDRRPRAGRHARRARVGHVRQDPPPARRDGATPARLHALRPVRRERGDAAATRPPTISRDVPGVAVHAVVGDFDRHLGAIPRGGRRLVAFLGGTIGNLNPAQRRRFLVDLDASLGPDDWLLLGTDLVKDPARLVAAYDDAAGVTAEFNRNVLARAEPRARRRLRPRRVRPRRALERRRPSGSRCGCDRATSNSSQSTISR